MALATKRVRRNRSVGNKLNDLESRVVSNEKKTIQDNSIGATQIADQGVATDNVQDRAVTSNKIELGAISTEHLSLINEVSSGGDFAINVGEEGHVSLEGTLYTTPYDSLTDTNDLYTLGFDPTNNNVVVYPDSPVTALAPISPNYLLNGAFNIWQRGTTFAATGYTADRWYMVETGASAATQYTAATTTLPSVPAGIEYAVRLSTTGTSDKTEFYQPLESEMVIPLRGKTLTFSCYVKMESTMAGNIKMGAWYSNVDDAYASQTTEVSSVTLVKADYADWVRASLTFTVPADADGLKVGFDPITLTPDGTDTFYWVAAAQLELGSVATAFRPNSPHYSAELAACQRYYYRKTSEATNGLFAFGMVSSTTTISQFSMFHPVPMRTIPVFGSSAASTFLSDDGAANRAGTSFTQYANQSNSHSALFALNYATGLTAYRPTRLWANANTAAYIEFSAEL